MFGYGYGLYCSELLTVYAAVPHYFSLQCYVAIALALWRGATARLSIQNFYVPPEYPPGRQGAVSGVTLKSGLHVFLACSIGYLR